MSGNGREITRRALLGSLGAGACFGLGWVAGRRGKAEAVLVRGLAVSHWQGEVSWDAVRASGMRWTYAKVTEGVDWEDPQWRRNAREATASGLWVGGYHFFLSYRSGRAQAEWFLRCWERVPTPWMPCVDLEHMSTTTGRPYLSEVEVFCEIVRERLGTPVVIYSSPEFCYTHLPRGLDFEFPLWIADYESIFRPDVPQGWRHWTLWQHTDRARIPGVGGRTTSSVLNADVGLPILGDGVEPRIPI